MVGDDLAMQGAEASAANSIIDLVIVDILVSVSGGSTEFHKHLDPVKTW